MKKYILPPVCSAFVVPGLGQILNHQIAKGMILLGSTFVLFIAGALKLALMVRDLAAHSGGKAQGAVPGMETGSPEGAFVLYLLLTLFGLVWLYAVIDAFFVGRKIERSRE